MEEDHIKHRFYNSLFGKKLGKILSFIFHSLGSSGATVKADAVFTAASLLICVCCFLSWTPLYISSHLRVPRARRFWPKTKAC